MKIENKKINKDDNRVLQVNEPTEIKLTVGNQNFKGYLNNSSTATALKSQLPISITLDRGSSDYCGIYQKLPYQNNDIQDGWFSGDISFDPNGNWLVLFMGGDNNRPGAKEVTLGQLADKETLDRISKLGKHIELTISKN